MTVVRLMPKYPLAVALEVDNQRSFLLWIQNNNTLLVLLFCAVSALAISSVYITKILKSAVYMKEEVHLLSKVVEHSPTMIMITDPAGSIEYVNRRFETETGYLRGEILNHSPKMFKSGETPDEDYAQMWRIISAGHTWNGEFHNKRKDGTLYWERLSIGSLADEMGSITHFIALKEPISDEKDAQEKLRLASTVFHSAAEAIMVTDRNNHIQMVNKSFEMMTGYAEADVLGGSPSILRSDKHPVAFYQDLFKSLEQSGTWSGEIWNKRKNGEIYPEWLTISSRLDHNGDLEGYVALFSDITQRKHDEEIILRQANYDSLTSLPNRKLFKERLRQSISKTDQGQGLTVLLYVNLDRFKYVNDTFGHHTGDLLLQQVTERLKSLVRKSDTVARLGGDEFAIILSCVDYLPVVERLVNKILKKLAEPYILNGNDAFISCSIGVALYPDNGSTLEEIIINADSAMYKAKDCGRNTYTYFNEELSENHQKRRDLEQGLHQALSRSEFFLVYQPIFSIDGQQVKAVEALIRWEHPDKGIVSPVEFIHLAEQSHLIHDIGEWVIREACAFSQRMSELCDVVPQVSINVSSVQFMKGNVGEILAEALDQHELKGENLVVEITENVLLLDQADIRSQLDEIVAMGIEIAVDDFGTGYSSLSYLKKYPVHRIKIDKSFVNELSSVHDDQVLVSTMLSLADSLSLKAVVEGVETKEQLQFLSSCGTPMIQGYLFAKPIREAELLDVLSANG